MSNIQSKTTVNSRIIHIQQTNCLHKLYGKRSRNIVTIMMNEKFDNNKRTYFFNAINCLFDPKDKKSKLSKLTSTDIDYNKIRTKGNSTMTDIIFNINIV